MWTLLSKLTGVTETTFPIQEEQKKEQKAQGWKGGEKTPFEKEKHRELGFLSLSSKKYVLLKFILIQI